ncbi:MAG: Sua5/YciO/YrdC/YwlC family protein [Pseudohongiellaceae bacterium]|nr:Sua5/YciO/YrdC/YwlC family protein [Pseudohongiellaceae bacterium]
MGQYRSRGMKLKRAVTCIRAGGVLAYPTEAIWGLGCDPFDRDACLRLLAIKKRPVEKGLILVAANTEQVAPLLDSLSPAQANQVLASWPGPTTWLIPDHNNLIPWWVKGEHTSVAVRVSAHPQVEALCREFGGPIVSTSANRAGLRPAKTALMVQKQMGNQVDCIFRANLGGSKEPSTIIDAVTGKVLR